MNILFHIISKRSWNSVLIKYIPNPHKHRITSQSVNSLKTALKTWYEWWLVTRSSLKIFCQRFIKCCLEAEGREQHFTNWRENFQWWSMTPVTICFVITQNQDQKFKPKIVCYFTLTLSDTSLSPTTTSMTPACIVACCHCGLQQWATVHICDDQVTRFGPIACRWHWFCAEVQQYSFVDYLYKPDMLHPYNNLHQVTVHSKLSFIHTEIKCW